MCMVCGVTTKRNKGKWIDHMNLLHPSIFSQFVQNRRQLRKEEREHNIAAEAVLEKALTNINEDVI